MKKSTWWIIAIVIIVIVVVALSGASNSEQTGPVKIGLSLPLTGDLAFIGEADKNAALLAMEEINANTSLKYEYELAIEDDSFDAQKGASSINKLITVNKVNALISIGSTVGNVAAPIAEENKIPHIGMASDPNVARGEYNFINWTRPQEEVTAMLQEMMKKNITTVAILAVNQQGMQAISDDFEKRAPGMGITVIAKEIFNPGQTDFRTMISKLQKSKPQIYLLGAFDPEIGIIGKQMRDLGITTPLTSIESFGLSADPKQFEGQWFVDATVPSSNFAAAYETKYGKAVGPAAPNVYDAIHLLVRAFESADSPDSADVIKALQTASNGYMGALGNLTVNEEGAFISQASVKVIKNGKAEVITK